jgi:hypothetical protein
MGHLLKILTCAYHGHPVRLIQANAQEQVDSYYCTRCHQACEINLRDDCEHPGLLTQPKYTRVFLDKLARSGDLPDCVEWPPQPTKTTVFLTAILQQKGGQRRKIVT